MQPVHVAPASGRTSQRAVPEPARLYTIVDEQGNAVVPEMPATT
jgi:hypothetical protein